MDQSQTEQAAALLWQARIEQRRIDTLPDHLRPHTLEEGHAIQDAMVAMAAQPVLGWKIAATSKAGQEHIGVTEPLAGRLFKNFVLKDGARLPAAPLHMKVMEAEFTFRIGRALPPRDAAYEQREVCDAVAVLHLAIEVPDARFDRFAEIGAAQIVADDAFASWFLLGPEVHGWRQLDLSTQRVRALKSDTVIAEGTGANVLGDPRIALTWLANHLAQRGIGLKEGDIITTGTCFTPPAVAAGDQVTAEFIGLGQVTVAFI
ncbi:2-keto-4-pentenoate hydratase [Dongia deserti]|uniref:2-keto-4-pentenoate hydratase n=1 Tax=Dongia deserti TaxID=2268030 RepID=UPI000E653A36|nr:fumarylacetoacetate hydrolase family protein [Dongia deserti]